MQEARFSANFKLTDKYDSPMFTVRADTMSEFIESLRALATEGIGTKVAQIDAHAKGKDATAQAVSAVRDTFPGAQVTSDSYEPPWNDAGQQLPASSGPRCEKCGSAAEYKEGVNKNGKPYKAFFCTASRDHAPKWL